MGDDICIFPARCIRADAKGEVYELLWGMVGVLQWTEVGLLGAVMVRLAENHDVRLIPRSAWPKLILTGVSLTTSL